MEAGRCRPPRQHFYLFFYYYAKEMRLLACDCEFSSLSCVCKVAFRALLSVPSCFMLH